MESPASHRSERSGPTLSYYLSFLLLAGSCTGISGRVAADAVVHHDLQVRIEPERGYIRVRDQITIPPDLTPAPIQKLEVTLHAGLAVDDSGDTPALMPGAVHGLDVAVRHYDVSMGPGRRRLTVRYEGRIQHPLSRTARDLGARQQVTAGTISDRGVYLSGASHWYPRVQGQLMTFSMEVNAPTGWKVVSQGARRASRAWDDSAPEVWEELHPQDDIYLVAGPFREYSRPAGVADAMVFLRQPDPGLAQSYLKATDRYLQLYSQLLGPYPYKKFALVENFWETGYGMPSFTLLGPRVIRLPFIIDSSFPHEILHNWWGNGVYVDYESGNWSEGLTAYLADHLMQERAGRGPDYRRAALQKYANYVSEGRDFPLTAFRARHGEASQAVGYNKALMLFHMVRLRLGDEHFVKGLRRFYAENRFRSAGYSDLQRAFEAESDIDLEKTFIQWTRRTGAPRLELADVQAREHEGGYRITGTLSQTQREPGYSLNVPVAVLLDGGDEAFRRTIKMNTRQVSFDFLVPGKPLRLYVDPEFDVFRRLDGKEIPASVGEVFGAERVLLVLPSGASDALKEAYAGVAQRWTAGAPGAELTWDSELKELPRDRAAWLFGWDNRFRVKVAEALKGTGGSMGAKEVRVGGERFERGANSLVLATRSSGAPSHGLGWLGSDNPAALPGLGRKIPHYGKYSYLVFAGDEPTNSLKGQWRVVDSPLILGLSEGAKAGDKPLTPLARDLTEVIKSLPALRLSSEGSAPGAKFQPQMNAN